MGHYPKEEKTCNSGRPLQGWQPYESHSKRTEIFSLNWNLFESDVYYHIWFENK